MRREYTNSMNELRPYQIEDLQKLRGLPSCALFNEQRTGKTPTSLMLAKANLCDRIVILTTKSSQYQWQQEFEKWLGLPCIICSGTPAKKKKQLQNWTNGLILTLDSFKSTKAYTGLADAILKENPDLIILDEAHRIKNHKSANAKAIFKTKKVPYKMALTGTPTPGRPYDIFSILCFLFPQDYPSFWRFLDQYFTIKDELIYTKTGPQHFKTYENFKSPAHKEQLQDFIASWSTNRKRKEVMEWLPKVYREQVKLPATPEQEKYIKELETTFETEHIITVGPLDRLIRLRQICADPSLLDLGGESPKTQFLLDYLAEHPDEPIIVFSKFSSYLRKIIYQIPNKHPTGLIVGETGENRRKMFIERFQDGTAQCLLLNIDANKESLTLDRAETTIFLDKYPPVGDIEQAEARFVTTTVENKDKPHKIIEVMIKDTYDERIYDLLARRKSETDIINDYANERRKRNGH